MAGPLRIACATPASLEPSGHLDAPAPDSHRGRPPVAGHLSEAVGHGRGTGPTVSAIQRYDDAVVGRCLQQKSLPLVRGPAAVTLAALRVEPATRRSLGQSLGLSVALPRTS